MSQFIPNSFSVFLNCVSFHVLFHTSLSLSEVCKNRAGAQCARSPYSSHTTRNRVFLRGHLGRNKRLRIKRPRTTCRRENFCPQRGVALSCEELQSPFSGCACHNKPECLTWSSYLPEKQSIKGILHAFASVDQRNSTPFRFQHFMEPSYFSCAEVSCLFFSQSIPSRCIACPATSENSSFLQQGNDFLSLPEEGEREASRSRFAEDR